ncbi:FadR/GntR family transcriptional regulator [Virgibacillus tibetensis]|uniref:FadR/GntR family transcriptional regulator n=1 Tax=Virgibacillus tibetensis TaxID=3042313 RepID=UPI002E177C30
MLRAEKISTKKVSEIVVEQIEDWIRTEKVMPEEKLPSVRELCDMFEVGRSAVRDALTTLKGKGLVVVKHGEGTFVCHRNTSHLFPDLMLLSKRDISELYQVRKIVEAGVVEVAAQNATADQLERMNLALGELSRAETVEAWEADYLFHQTIAEACANDILTDLMKAVSDTMKKGIMDCHRLILSDKKLSADIAGQHIAIYEAIKANDPISARKAMLSHLTYVEELLNSHLQDSSNE